MKKKILWVLVVIVLFISVPAFAKTRTTSLSLVNLNFQYVSLPEIITYSAVGIGFRSVTCKNDVGFYNGIDVSVGAVLLGSEFSFNDFDLNMSFITGQSLFLGNLSVPFGKRWAGEGKKSGFFLGGGPEIDALFGEGLMLFAGGFIELGIQTNKTEGIGFHFGYRLGFTPIAFEGGNIEFSFDPMFLQTSLQFGMSWRRIKD